MKKLRSIIVLFSLCLCANSQSCISGSYWQKQRVVFTVYGSDCVNCYLGASSAYQQLRQKLPVTFVLGGVGKRVAGSFMDEKIGSVALRDSIIISDSLFNCLCPGLSSSIVIIRNNKILVQMPFKNLDWPRLKQIIAQNDTPVQSADDTINISPFAGTAQTTYTLVNNNEIDIYNNLTSVMYAYDFVDHKLIKKYDFRFLRDSSTAFIDACIELNPEEKKINKEMGDQIVAKMGSRQVLMQPYVETDAIYVPVTFRAAKRMKLEDQKDTTLAIMPTQFLVKLDKEFRPLAYYSFPWRVKGASTVYNDTHGGHLEGKDFWMVTSGRHNDSLIALYSFYDRKCSLKELYNLSVPPYFPEKNKYGMPVGFSGFFTRIQNQLIYVFNVDPALQFFKDKRSISLSGFDTLKFTSDADPVNWISSVTEEGGRIVVTGGKQKGPTYLYVYNGANFELEHKIKLSDAQPDIVGYKNKKIFISQLNDENAFLIIRDIGQIFE